MNIYDKIELFNKLKNELEEVYGSFDTIDIVEEYPNDMRVEDGIHYFDTDGCCENVPIGIAVKRE
ncbi:MAG TPA: hypothetical protein VIK78_14630 [Ruminiclostridium sp.]